MILRLQISADEHPSEKRTVTPYKMNRTGVAVAGKGQGSKKWYSP